MTNEEKIIKIVKNYLSRIYSEFSKVGAVGIPNEEFFAIQGLLDLYNKEKEKNKELESDKEIKDKMIELMLEELTDCEFEMKCSECCCECEKDYDQLYECNKQYFENKAKESGDENE